MLYIGRKGKFIIAAYSVNKAQLMKWIMCENSQKPLIISVQLIDERGGNAIDW